jgi:hypothetical protein
VGGVREDKIKSCTPEERISSAQLHYARTKISKII